MIDIALNPISNDLIFEDFDLFLVDEVDQIMQNLAIRLRFFLNEWYLDVTQGLPFYELFFIKAPNEIQIESILKNEIVSTRGIAELTSYSQSYEPRTRIFTVRFGARTFTNEEILKEMEIPV